MKPVHCLILLPAALLLSGCVGVPYYPAYGTTVYESQPVYPAYQTYSYPAYPAYPTYPAYPSYSYPSSSFYFGYSSGWGRHGHWR